MFEHLSKELLTAVIDVAMRRYLEHVATQYRQQPWPLTEPEPLRPVKPSELPREPPPRTFHDQKLRDMLGGLPGEMRTELTALMWFGRGGVEKVYSAESVARRL